MRTRDEIRQKPLLRSPAEIRAMCQTFTEEVLDKFVELLRTGNQTIAYHAGMALLMYGNGKPVQQIAVEQVSEQDKMERRLADWLAVHRPEILQEMEGGAWKSLPLRPKAALLAGAGPIVDGERGGAYGPGSSVGDGKPISGGSAEAPTMGGVGEGNPTLER